MKATTITPRPLTSAGCIRRWIASTAIRTDHQQQPQPVDEGSHDFSACQAIGVPASGRARGYPGGEPGQAQGSGIGEHVPGIAQQRERTERQPGYELDERIAQGQMPTQAPARRALRRARDDHA